MFLHDEDGQHFPADAVDEGRDGEGRAVGVDEPGGKGIPSHAGRADRAGSLAAAKSPASLSVYRRRRSGMRARGTGRGACRKA